MNQPGTYTLHDRGSNPADAKAVKRAEAFQKYQEACLAMEKAAEHARSCKRQWNIAESDLRNAVDKMHSAEEKMLEAMQPEATDDVLKDAIWSSARETAKRMQPVK